VAKELQGGQGQGILQSSAELGSLFRSVMIYEKSGKNAGKNVGKNRSVDLLICLISKSPM